MRLSQVLARKALVVLGLNSGTSADGLDLAVLRISGSSSSHISFLAGQCQPYPSKLRESVLALSHDRDVSLDHLIYLDNVLGAYFGRVAADFIRDLAHRKIAVDLIASHGQTIRHLPRRVRFLGQMVRGTLQLGSLEQIAARTGRCVVGDFRQADIAIGNEGAPITVAAMARLFGDARRSRLILNVGGMANYFYFPAGARPERTLAADTGPGNSLSDLLTRQLFGQTFDRSGKHAARGIASAALVRSVMRHPFFVGSGKSTGREAFGQAMADRMIAKGRSLHLTKEDILAGAVEVTVEGICRKVRPILKRDRTLEKLYLTGGGVHNTFLVTRLREALAPYEVTSVATLGHNPDLVEASSYAVMGWACLRSQALPTAFGSLNRQRVMAVLGKIVQPPVEG